MTLDTSVVHNDTAGHGEREDDSGNGIIAVTPSHPQHERLVEPMPKKSFTKEEYPQWIGQKFEPDGHLLPFPGNTIICHLPPESQLYRALLGLHDELKCGEFASLQVLLPPTSWHMTVFEGVSDTTRHYSSWPDNLPLDEPLESCTALFRQKLAGFDLGTEPPFRMAVYGFEPLGDGVALRVVPANPAEERRLRDLRDRLSTLLQTRHPGHDHYSFHVSVSYMLRHLSKQDHHKIWTFLQGYLANIPEYFELGAPEFCTFNDMFAFRREIFLGTKS